MNSKEYWAKREAEQLKHNITEEAEYDKEIQRIYSNMLDACNKEINAFYGKYADKEGITLAEAKKRVSALDIKEYERKAERYVKDKDFSPKANEEMRLYNATMKINRLEMLKANIGLEMIKGHDELDKFMGDILKGRTMAELERQAGILGKTVRNNAKTAHAIVNGSFHSGTFSDRIWQYQDIMREDLGKLLQTGLIRGKNPRAIAGDLKKYWYGNDPKTGGGAKYCMERLMRTELARVQTEAQKQSFERNGFEKYIFIVNGDCCSICEDAKNNDIGHGKGVYLVKDMMPGENASPMHPHCRCSTAAYSDRKEYEEWLDYLEKGGTTEEYNKMKGITPVAPKTAEKQAEKQQQAQNSSNSETIESINKKLADLENRYANSLDLNEWIEIEQEMAQLVNLKTKLLKEQAQKESEARIKVIEKDIVSSGMFNKVSLNGCDVDSAQAIASTVEKIKTRYPDVKLERISITGENVKGERFTEIDSIGKTKSAIMYANGTKQSKTSITFNGKYFNNSAPLREKLKDNYKKGIMSTGSIEGVVAHEFGHALCDKYDISELEIHHSIVTELGMDFREAYGGTSKAEYESKLYISEYGETSLGEWFAECFADYMTNENPKEISVMAVETFEEMLRKKKK